MSQARTAARRTVAPRTAGAGATSSRLGLALLVIATAQLMVLLDATIVNVALPHIQRALGFSGSGLEWVVNAYALAFGGLMLLGGRAGDLLGRRKVFIAGLLAVLRRLTGRRVRHLPGLAARRPSRPGSRRRDRCADRAGADHDHLPAKASRATRRWASTPR